MFNCAILVIFVEFKFSSSRAPLSGNNILTGIGSGLQELPNLTHLIIANNPSFAGPFPSELLQMTKLQVFEASECGLTGQIPAGIVGMSTLTKLSVENNDLTGTVPVLPPLLNGNDNCRLGKLVRMLRLQAVFEQALFSQLT